MSTSAYSVFDDSRRPTPTIPAPAILAPETANLRALLESVRIDPDTEYERPTAVLSIGEQAIGTLGNFSLITGKAKSRKTFFTTAIAAAALSEREVCGVTGTLPEGKKAVLYFDTEQSHADAATTARRILEQAGTQYGDNLHFFGLRKFTPAERASLIEAALQSFADIGLCVIDGIRDLVSNINNEQEATTISSALLRWTEEYNCHIVTILHQNKADNNARGHVGTELINKAETTLTVTKHEHDESVSIVAPEYCRGIQPEKIAFCITDGLPERMEDFEFNATNDRHPKVTPDMISLEDHQKVLKLVFKDDYAQSYKELASGLKDGFFKLGHPIGDNKLREFLAYYIRKGMILGHGSPQSKARKYTINLPF